MAHPSLSQVGISVTRGGTPTEVLRDVDLDLVEDATYVHARAAVLEFLYARHAKPAALAA